MTKSTYIAMVQQTMGDGGDDQQGPPPPPRKGTVRGIATNDKLNIRASSSSSSPIIGQAENGDVLTVTGEAYNGSTKWLRFRVGQEAGIDVAVFGWVSSQYVILDPPAKG